MTSPFFAAPPAVAVPLEIVVVVGAGGLEIGADVFGPAVSLQAVAAAAVEALGCGHADAVVVDARGGSFAAGDCCRRIRQHPDLRDRPLIVLVAPGRRHVIPEVLEAGADSVADVDDGATAVVATLASAVRRHRAQHTLSDATQRQSMDEVTQLRRDFEALAHAVSHDLRAPLRSIDGFSAALADLLASDLPPKAADYLQRVRGAARRLDQMIAGLLDLSRVGRGPCARQPVDLSALARTTAAALARHYSVEPVLTVTDGVVADADRNLSQRLFEIILDNCFKFRAPTNVLTVGIDVVDAPGGREYTVRDNGVGFDTAYADKLFRPFQRLHGVGEYPGVGMGLAVAHRIVARHGGRIAIDGRPGGGAVVTFTLPPRPGQLAVEGARR